MFLIIEIQILQIRTRKRYMPLILAFESQRQEDVSEIKARVVYIAHFMLARATSWDSVNNKTKGKRKGEKNIYISWTYHLKNASIWKILFIFLTMILQYVKICSGLFSYILSYKHVVKDFFLKIF